MQSANAVKNAAPARAKPRHTAIPIDHEYRLTADQYCWHIQRCTGTRKNRKTGESELHWKSESYHPSVESAVGYLAELKLRQSGAQSFEELLRVQEEIRGLIKKALPPKNAR